MGFKKYIKETAAAGSIGAGSIAVNMDASPKSRENTSSFYVKKLENIFSDRDKNARLKKKKYEKDKNKKSFSSFMLSRSLSEDFDIGDIVSRLRSLDIETSNANKDDVVSFGVEDDKGNVMTITVKADQAQEFEETMARKLADDKDNKANGIDLKGNSLAEILYNLRDEFEIVDVAFPKIPSDVVYNADMASRDVADDQDSGDFDDLDAGQGGDMSMNGQDDGMGLDDGAMGDQDANIPQDNNQMDDDGSGMNGQDDGMDLDDPDASPNPQDQNAGMNPNDDMSGADAGMNPDDASGADAGMADGDNVEDYGQDDESPQSTNSLLSQILAMLKSQADAQEAQADAAAEEARAKQAEWSAIAADKEVKRQEELARVQAQIDADKKKEKDAKKYAELARYRVDQARDISNESKSTFLSRAIEAIRETKNSCLTEDEFDNVQTLQKELVGLPNKYKILPTDDSLTQKWKTLMLQYDTDELKARINAVKATTLYQQQKSKETPQTTQTNQTQNNPTVDGTSQAATPSVPTGNGQQAGGTGP